MSRSFDSTSLTTLAVDRDLPPVMSSSPASMRSSVDLPQPDGPDQHHELAVGDVEADAVDDLGRAEGLLDVAGTRRMPWRCLAVSSSRRRR